MEIKKGFEQLIYLISCVLLLGTPWILKIIIKLAIIEAKEIKCK